MTDYSSEEWVAKAKLAMWRWERIPVLRETPGDAARDELAAMLDDVSLQVIGAAATVLAARDVESLDLVLEAWRAEEGSLEGESMRDGITQLALDGEPLEEILADRVLHGRPTVREAAAELMEWYHFTPPQVPDAGESGGLSEEIP